MIHTKWVFSEILSFRRMIHVVLFIASLISFSEFNYNCEGI